MGLIKAMVYRLTEWKDVRETSIGNHQSVSNDRVSANVSGEAEKSTT